MPKNKQVDPNKKNPKGLRKAKKGKKWVPVSEIGEFIPDAVQSKKETTRLTKKEKAKGLTQIDKNTIV